MAEPMASVPLLLSITVASYLLGALPLADQVSRRSGVDIFSAGTGLAGASNVLRSVGKWPALLVFLGDFGKGVLAVFVARRLGIEGLWLLLPTGAVIVGHWNSVFTGLRGGDGLASLGGITLAAIPSYGAASVAVAMLVSFGGQKLPYTSLLNIVAGYATLLLLSLFYGGNTVLAFGLGGVSAVVLAHAMLSHRRKRATNEWSGAGSHTGQTGLPS